MPDAYDNLCVICTDLDKIGLFTMGAEPLPAAAHLAAAAADGAKFLPTAYQAAYTTPLMAGMSDVLKLRKAHYSSLEMYTAAAYQHRPADPYVDQLKRCLAVVSDIYQSFLAVEKHKAIGLNMVEILPPLAMFQHDGSLGPQTLPVEKVQGQLAAASVGIVSLPQTCADHPVTWAALAHETGGHDVIHAIPNLLEEMSQGVGRAFFGMTADPSFSSDDLAQLWSHWIDEATADVYGLLNVGPSFAFNNAAFLVLFVKDIVAGVAHLRMSIGFHDNNPNKILDGHPVDILRMHLLIGVIENLVSLSTDTKANYVARITQMTAKMAQGSNITLVGTVPGFGPNAAKALNRADLPLDYMQEAARRVGAYIATTPFTALNNHNIQDIETWDDADEAAALAIRGALLAGGSITGLGDDARLLAGASLALMEQPGLYAAITIALNAALDESYTLDKVWNKI